MAGIDGVERELYRKQLEAMRESVQDRILQLEVEFDQCNRRARKALNAVEFSGYELARKQQQAAAASLIRCRRRLREIEAELM